MLLSGLIFLTCNTILDTDTKILSIDNCILQDYNLTPVTSTESVVTSTESAVTSTESVVTSTESVVTSTESVVTSTESVVTSTENNLAERYAPTIIAGSGLSLVLLAGIASYIITKNKKEQDQETPQDPVQESVDISRPVQINHVPNPRTYNNGNYM